jgi:hypothetical protein
MKTFRQNWDNVVYSLKMCGELGIPQEDIRKGELGKIPSSAPFILVFAKPSKGTQNGGYISSERAMKFVPTMDITIFCGVTGEDDLNESLIKALELCEICGDNLPASFQQDTISLQYDFDAHYSNYSVAYLTIVLQYIQANDQ